MQEKTLGVGIVGCGNISQAYFSLAPLFRGVKVVACADIDRKASAQRAAEFDVRDNSLEELLDADDVDIVVNLTIPAAHHDVSKAALLAGKHVYSEKPFVLSLEEGLALAKLADEKKLRIGSAPDTFLGGAHQHARHLVDSGAIGKITGGTAFVMNHGMEHWHPNPDFFYQKGGGPILDIGPYYITDLVQLIGSVEKVAALTAAPSRRRTISSEPRAGETIPVETPTTIHALLQFANGAVVTFGASWDVWSHEHGNIELYGEKGTLYVPDPNFFGGALSMTEGTEPVSHLEAYDHPFSVPNQEHHSLGPLANYRTAGLSDMALAILEGRPHRCSLELALHVIDIMTSILKSGETGEFVTITIGCERPRPLGMEEARAMLVQQA
ncbi:Gfo/Idh/MocA family oxidoreductase [Hoeflea sp. WL0058]|uniref:Gfo/Idh/MocA family oxidoreductase n=1 Tax=Flavimaribacter sediminis TaxID=2865987 RepID=A0AAE2ZP39_9HYPH|nr:Gfo/Idh/MocA family oxidoreductase [Flavimaribacter sediminis]MBW8638266.1 Gfo/Idh/MocA family oxidoreductase [Flavimaribacter sediminis]